MANGPEEQSAAGEANKASGNSSVRRWIVRVALSAGLFAVAFASAYLLASRNHRAQTPPPAQTPPAQVVIRLESPATRPVDTVPAVAPVTEEVLSWSKAERAMAQGRFQEAADIYASLLAAAQKMPSAVGIGEFLQLRYARCRANLGHYDEARMLLDGLAHSEYQAIRAVANYDHAVLMVMAGEALAARSRAYAALAALYGLEATGGMDADCDRLIAQSLSRKVFTYNGLDLGLNPQTLWRKKDLFSDLDDARLRAMLDVSAVKEGSTLLGPQVRRVSSPGEAAVFEASCYRAPLEEVLQTLGAASGLSIRWQDVSDVARRRPVTMTLPAMPAQRISEIACGMMGLICRFTGGEGVIYDPAAGDDLSAKRDLLTVEASSAWRRFILRFPDSPYQAEAHLAVAALQEFGSDESSALAEYRMVVTRFPADPVAAMAMRRSAAIRMRLRDYAGARNDLLDLLNQYPDCRGLEDVYLSLAQATTNIGLHKQALSDYSKLYYLDLSAASRQQACLGAAAACRMLSDHAGACLWFERYLGMVEPTSSTAVQAMADWAQSLTALNKDDQAVAILQKALAGNADGALRNRVLTDLAVTQASRRQYVAALGALSQITRDDMNAAQRDRLAVVTARVYSDMGLPERAVKTLHQHVASSRDQKLSMLVGMEIAHSLAEQEDWSAARDLLSELMSRTDQGESARSVMLEMVRASLKSGKVAQAVSVAQELLKQPADDTRREVLRMMAEAYIEQQDYPMAVLSLSGMALPASEGGRP